MTYDDDMLFPEDEDGEDDRPGANAPSEMSVSELSFKLKSMVENEFGYVRVRGEISRVTVARSGHMYTSLKDENAVLDAVCWKGNMARLSIKPEEGLDVVCTGRLTTYPGRSNYQIIIETMELAGEGALLKMLEERRKKLAAEGLFDEARKKPIPFLPRRIGVVTSPTGAVIRDIMHRLSDRFPRHVLLWPVVVQGDKAAQQVSEAIAGFNALPEDSPYRPDLLIVARGGGSLEDLMPFNDEAVVRAAAASDIPLISAVGHETDTTLIDLASDLRAPTPTGAAEKAVPVRADLMEWTSECDARMKRAMQRRLTEHKTALQGLGRGLGDPKRLLETVSQKLDHLTSKLDRGLTIWVERRAARIRELAAALSPQTALRNIANEQRHLQNVTGRLHRTGAQTVKDKTAKLNNVAKLLETLSFERVLDRGFVLVTGPDGAAITSSTQPDSGDAVSLRFKDGSRDAVIDGATGASPTPKKKPPAKKKKTKPADDKQGDLF